MTKLKLFIGFSLLLVGLLASSGQALRPDGVMRFNSDFCICKNGKPGMGMDKCADFCSIHLDPLENLHANFSLDHSLMSHTQVSNLRDWCTMLLQRDSIGLFEMINPQCAIQAVSSEGTVIYFNLDMTNFVEVNSIKVNVAQLENYSSKEWKLYLIERNSGAKSDFVVVSRSE